MTIQEMIGRLVTGQDVSAQDFADVMENIEKATWAQVGGLAVALYMRWQKEKK